MNAQLTRVPGRYYQEVFRDRIDNTFSTLVKWLEDFFVTLRQKCPAVTTAAELCPATVRQRHSMRMLAALATLAHFAISCRTYAENSAGVPNAGSIPTLVSRSL